MNQNIWGFPNNASTTYKESFDSSWDYKVYTALLSQSGGDPPTGTVLQNTLGVNVTWTYINPGVYFGTLDKNIFTSPNEYVTITGSWSPGGGDLNTMQVQVLFVNIILVSSFSNGILADDIIGQTALSYPPCVLEIRKYQ